MVFSRVRLLSRRLLGIRRVRDKFSILLKTNLSVPNCGPVERWIKLLHVRMSIMGGFIFLGSRWK